MKKLILISILVAIHSINGFSQPYKSIFSEGTTRWNVNELRADGGGTVGFLSNTDTIIDEKLYYKLYSTPIFYPEQELFFYESDTAGFILEDTLEGKYWLRKFTDGVYKEELFMDLSMNVGDTFKFHEFNPDYNYDFIVDSIYFEDFKKIIRLYELYCPYEEKPIIKFIEGIGASNGFYLANTLYYCEDEEVLPHELICKFDNESLVYSTDFDINGNCWLIGGGEINQNTNKESIVIYPNPSNSIINFKLPEQFNSPVKYEIYNCFGNIVSDGLISHQNSSLNIEKSGVYYIKLFNHNIHINQKIIIL